MNNCVEGRKRQLPSWMKRPVSVSVIDGIAYGPSCMMPIPKVDDASHESDSGNVVEANHSIENEAIGAANVKKIDCKKETIKRKSNSSAKGEVKGKTNLDQRNEMGDDDANENKKKKAIKSKDGAPRRSTKKRGNLEDLSHGGSDDVCLVQVSSDDDMELTVDDLMAIAEQYVKDYEEKELQETSSRQCEPNWQFPATAEAGTTLDSFRENKKPSNSVREALYNSSPATEEVIPTSTSQIGHPAQDMLDVFLGPLLRNL